MTDPMELFWASLESERPLFTEADLRRWPEGYGRRLCEAGLLRLAEIATHVVCPGCHSGHIEPVIPQVGPVGMRFYVRCPETLRVEVPADHLRQWTVALDALVKALASALRPGSRSREVVPGRLWKLCKMPWRESQREIFLARGLGWPDSPAVTAKIPPVGRPIVLVPDAAPPRNIWSTNAPAVVSLSRVATLDDGKIAVDMTDMAAVVNEADMTARLSAAETLHEAPSKKLTQIVRQAQMTGLTDEALVRAYAEHGSYRKAADALVAQGHQTDRWAVERAVKKLGGVEKVRRIADSQSVRRTVVSQRRDSGRKPLQYPQAPDSE
jgi:hypothetical protein